jgi:hypothetical protein
MAYALVLLVAVSIVGLVYVWRAIQMLPAGTSANSPASFAETLVWYDGELSPNGRKVLWIEPAAERYATVIHDVTPTDFFSRGCPVDENELQTQWPEDHVKEKVSWALNDEEIERMRKGFVPEVLEDRWRMMTFKVDGSERCYVLRVSDGKLMYVLDVGEHGIRWVWRGARDAMGVEIARALIEGFLLGHTCVIPAPRNAGEDKSLLMAWGIRIAGRRCKAVEPQTN